MPQRHLTSRRSRYGRVWQPCITRRAVREWAGASRSACGVHCGSSACQLLAPVWRRRIMRIRRAAAAPLRAGLCVRLRLGLPAEECPPGTAEPPRRGAPRSHPPTVCLVSPSPGADVTGASSVPVPVQRRAQHRCRCGQRRAQIPVQMWAAASAAPSASGFHLARVWLPCDTP
jgi:hypothetical protein